MNMPSLETDRYNWDIREQEDRFIWPSTGPQDGGGGESGGNGGATGGVGSATARYFADLTKQVKDYLNPISDYFSQLKTARDEMEKNQRELQGYADAFRDDPMGAARRILVQHGEEGFKKQIVQKIQDLRTGKAGTGFLPKFIAKTQAGMAKARIPESPRADIGKAPDLRQRVNTKDFYK